MRSILEVKAGEAFMSQIMKGCGGHAEEFGVYLEDSGATKGLLAREREDQIFVGERSYSREQTGCPREESFSPGKYGAGGLDCESKDRELVFGSFLSPLEFAFLPSYDIP